MIYVLQNLLTQAQASAGDFACSAGELEIESESWSLQPKAEDLASMILINPIPHGGGGGGQILPSFRLSFL